MRILRTKDEKIREASITIGTFDGLHLGHQAILNRTKEEGKKLSLPVGVLTFEPPPYTFFHKEFPFLLTPLSEKLSLLAEMGMDFVLIIDFDERIANLSPEDFLNEIKEELSPRVLTVGSDFRFGRERKGDIRFLQRVKEKCGFQLVVVELIKKSGILVKSTTIREKLLLGNMKLVNLLLGRRYALFCRVVKGTGRGREIGFPTLNLQPLEPNKLLPIDGVYAVYFYPEISSRNFYQGVMNIGTRPTFEGRERQIEVHLIGKEKLTFQPQEVKVEICQRIRPEKKFSTIEELREEIKKDIQNAERILREGKEGIKI
ncbi:MAG: riboflavin biosynthesis protein RibF [candidate division WOR-3 bacterium]